MGSPLPVGGDLPDCLIDMKPVNMHFPHPQPPPGGRGLFSSKRFFAPLRRGKKPQLKFSRHLGGGGSGWGCLIIIQIRQQGGASYVSSVPTKSCNRPFSWPNPTSPPTPPQFLGMGRGRGRIMEAIRTKLVGTNAMCRPLSMGALLAKAFFLDSLNIHPKYSS